jgi:hypothetical protein
MLEITTHELTVIGILSFFAGIFASIWLSRLLEVVHAWKIVQEAIISVLWMLSKMNEDVAFLREIRYKQMRDSGFTEEQMRKFQEVDDKFLTNWKDSAIVSIVKRSPRHFRSMMPFNDWSSATRFLNKALRGEQD